MTNPTAYYSAKLESWVRLERCEDGEFCHTSGYATRDEALGTDGPVVTKSPEFSADGLPSFLAR
jgi:hypothetical protein